MALGSDGTNGFIGAGDFGLQYTAREATGLPWAEYLFQVALAATTSAMVAGAAAERLTNHAFIASSIVMSILVSIMHA